MPQAQQTVVGEYWGSDGRFCIHRYDTRTDETVNEEWIAAAPWVTVDAEDPDLRNVVP